MAIRLTHDEALDLVYDVIARLRSSGKSRISISEVADIAGVARSTINSKKDPDWIEVRDVILHNKTNQRLKLALANYKVQSKWQVEASRLKNELAYCQDALNELTARVDGDFRKILDQLHKYMFEARKLPARIDKDTKRIQENNDLKSKNELLEAENRRLKAKFLPDNTVLPFIKKSIINVYPEDQRGNLQNLLLDDLAKDAVLELDQYFESSFPPEAIYVLCGNFASGKSVWISDHRPPVQESQVVVYIDGTSHTKAIRKEIVRYVRHLNNKHTYNCKVVCVRTLAGLEQCLKWNNDPDRIRTKHTISEDLIKIIDRGFSEQEVAFDEGFNEIILVEGV